MLWRCSGGDETSVICLGVAWGEWWLIHLDQQSLQEMLPPICCIQNWMTCRRRPLTWTLVPRLFLWTLQWLRRHQCLCTTVAVLWVTVCHAPQLSVSLLRQVRRQHSRHPALRLLRRHSLMAQRVHRRHCTLMLQWPFLHLRTQLMVPRPTYLVSSQHLLLTHWLQLIQPGRNFLHRRRNHSHLTWDSASRWVTFSLRCGWESGLENAAYYKVL